MRLPFVPRISSIDTPLGIAWYAYGPDGVLVFSPGVSRAAFIEGAATTFGVLPIEEAPAREMRERIERCVASGDGSCVDIAWLPAFQQRVLRACAEIPFGAMQSYGWIADRIGSPRAVRAVGTALARNPVPLLIPCHRVIRADGALGNYGLGGTERKRDLLTLEGALPAPLGVS